MRMAFRGTATATALALAWAAAVGCSSRGHGTRDAADASAVSAAPAAAAANPAQAASAKITQAALNEDTDGARVVLSADAPLLYTSYEPRPDLLIVDLRDATVADGFQTPAAVGGLVESIKFEELDELGKRITRLSIAHRPNATPDVRSVGQGLAIAFNGAPAPAEAETVAESAPVASAPSAAPAETVVATALTPDAAPAPAVSSAARGEMAHVLESIVAENRDGHVEIALLGDGWFTPRDFVLANPPRIVLDLPGVKNEVRQRAISVKGELVSRVRVSQFQTSPEYVTRVVVDLTRPMPHTIVPDGERLAVLIGADVSRAEAAPAVTTTVAAAAPVEAKPEPVAEPAQPPVSDPAPSPTTLVQETAPPAETPAVSVAAAPVAENKPCETSPCPTKRPSRRRSSPSRRPRLQLRRLRLPRPTSR